MEKNLQIQQCLTRCRRTISTLKVQLMALQPMLSRIQRETGISTEEVCRLAESCRTSLSELEFSESCSALERDMRLFPPIYGPNPYFGDKT